MPDIEVQILADQHGQAISLYGRDSLVQQHHLKIMEETHHCCCKPNLGGNGKSSCPIGKEVGGVLSGNSAQMALMLEQLPNNNPNPTTLYQCIWLLLVFVIIILDFL